jgi:hypothetical protein
MTVTRLPIAALACSLGSRMKITLSYCRVSACERVPFFLPGKGVVEIVAGVQRPVRILALYQAVTPPAPGTPTAITLTPTSATIPDNAPAGTLLATANVTMSDGSQFSGTLTTSNTNIFAISGMNIVTARALTSVDDGTQSTVITASQGSQSLSMKFSI